MFAALLTESLRLDGTVQWSRRAVVLTFISFPHGLLSGV